MSSNRSTNPNSRNGKETIDNFSLVSSQQKRFMQRSKQQIHNENSIGNQNGKSNNNNIASSDVKEAIDETKSYDKGKQRQRLNRQMTIKELPKIEDASDLKQCINRHLFYTLLRDRYNATDLDLYTALAMGIRDQIAAKWIQTDRQNRETNPKFVYYISMEFYMGRLLKNAINNLNLRHLVQQTIDDLGLDIRTIYETEKDAGLGNGGLGRLAACYLDSMATLKIPCFGYGLRYEYGIFEQVINERGEQEERADSWLEMGYVWEVARVEDAVDVHMCGRIENGKWIDTQIVKAIPHDIPIPGYKNDFIGTLRLWRAKATTELSFEMFNTGDYVKAVENKNKSENLTRILYPDDRTYTGKELRLRQEYFLVSASIRDILNRFMLHQTLQTASPNRESPLSATSLYRQICNSNAAGYCSQSSVDSMLCDFSNKVAIQLNDTHPSLAIPELMRIFLDDFNLPWDSAWRIVRNSFYYTNHTVLPEALEKWPVEMLEKVVPRHLQIIYLINMNFLAEVQVRIENCGNSLIRNMSLIEEGSVKSVRMAYLSIVGSSRVNGVARVHSNLIKETLFKEFVNFFENKEHFVNVTNGVTPRRWLAECNPELSALIDTKIDDDWISNMKLLENLLNYKEELNFLEAIDRVKQEKKRQFAKFLATHHGLQMNDQWLLSVQVKRIHEYKRQLLNLLNCIILFVKLKKGEKILPRTFVIGGKAAPAYFRAKKIIRLINCVAQTIDNDDLARNFLKLIFLPNYDVSTAEIAIPAANISEQISLAGMEASGTGNMKFMMNGALTLGTLDGANMEIYEAVGESNMFAFGMTIPEVPLARETYAFDREHILKTSPELNQALNMIASGYFLPNDPHYFEDIVHDLRNSDYYMLLKDLQDYTEKSEAAASLYYNKRRSWNQAALVNIAKSGVFSSDVSIKNYADKIWHVKWSTERLDDDL